VTLQFDGPAPASQHPRSFAMQIMACIKISFAMVEMGGVGIGTGQTQNAKNLILATRASQTMAKNVWHSASDVSDHRDADWPG
jgi:hypothetical protein